MKKNILLNACILALAFGFGLTTFAEETVVEKAETAVDKTTDAAKRAYRKGKDEACPIVDGKVNCLAKKVKHKVKNASDKAKTKANEIKNEND